MLLLALSLNKSKDSCLGLNRKSILICLRTAFTHELRTDLNRDFSTVNSTIALPI